MSIRDKFLWTDICSDALKCVRDVEQVVNDGMCGLKSPETVLVSVHLGRGK